MNEHADVKREPGSGSAGMVAPVNRMKLRMSTMRRYGHGSSPPHVNPARDWICLGLRRTLTGHRLGIRLMDSATATPFVLVKISGVCGPPTH